MGATASSRKQASDERALGSSAVEVLWAHELWENVFRFLPLRSLARAAQVCKLFSQVAWPTIIVDGALQLDENILRYLLSKRPQELRISNCPRLAHFGPAILIACPTITRLRIQGIPFTSVGIEHVARGFLSLYGRITEFSLRDCGLDDNAAAIIAECLPHAYDLTVVNLSENNITSRGLVPILDALACTRIAKLNMSGNPLRETGVAALATFLGKCASLQALAIDLVDMGNAGIERLAIAIRHNKTLRELHIAENNIDQRGIMSLARAMEENRGLRVLDLHANSIESEGCSTLANSLKKNRTLRELNVWDNRIGYAGAVGLGALLEANSTIETLNMKFNGVGPDGAISIARALQVNRSLHQLNMSYCYIGDVGAVALSRALETNTILLVLDLENNEVGDVGATKLGEALRRNNTLHQLSLPCNRIGDAGATGLAAGLAANASLSELDLSGLGKGARLIGPSGAGKLAEALLLNSALKKLVLERNYLTSEHERLFRCGSCSVRIVRPRTGAVVRRRRSRLDMTVA
eukprot:m.27554 g.27554  ORF g.27554 m.27554 type:complete len:525 (-) comp4434_c1_seq1:60-1634(-)